TKGALGYIEMLYAMNTRISFATMENAQGKWIKADVKTVTEAAASTPEKEITDDLCFSMTNAPGEGAYPISGVVWAVLYIDQEEPGKAKALKEFLTWATHDGQKYCEKLHYAPLSENLVKKIDAKLGSLKAAGK